MKPKSSEIESLQGELFKTRLESFLNMDHPLIRLAQQMDWAYFESEFGLNFDDRLGRPALPMRLMVGLTYLKHLYNFSDELVVEQFLESGYWQYFCGFEYFQKDFPCDSSSLTRFRKRIGDQGAEKLLANTLNLAHKLGLLRSRDCKQVIVDTTVQEKNIAFPTDAKLLFRAREKLVAAAEEEDLVLRQTYRRVGKHLLLKQSKYAHAKQYKRSKRAVKKLRTQLGRVIRDIERKCQNPSEKLKNLLTLSKRLFDQKKEDSRKLYSLHEPNVECIAKGKAHKPYEFGCKAGIVVTAKKSWIIGARAFHNRPYDGSTLKGAIHQAEKITGVRINAAFVDKGYRGSKHWPTHTAVYVSGRKRLKSGLKKLLKRRSAVEPVIGHLKSDHRLGVNFLKGIEGDKLNIILASSAYNLRKILRGFSFVLRIWIEKLSSEPKLQLPFS